jgi:peptidoglycan/LPS O-acetylase OafA/YrhL
MVADTQPLRIATAVDSPSSTSRIVGLDLLRGLAALSVAIPHFFIYYGTSSLFLEAVSVLGVEVFFVLSGFVLAPQILFCMQRGDGRTLLRFLVRRWMRTIPPYVVALLAISVLTHKLYTAEFWRYFFYVQNLAHQSDADDYYAVAWSLSIEEWFYVCFPALLLLSGRMLGTRSRAQYVAIALIVIVVVAIARALAGDFDDWGVQVRRVVVFRIDSIVYGFLLYLLLERLNLTLALRWALLVGSAAFGLAVSMLIAETDDLVAKHLFPFGAAIFGMSAVLVFRQIAEPSARRGALRATSLFLGRISYGVYLFHMQVLYLVHEYGGALPAGGQFAAYLGATITFTWVFFLVFERPILAARPALGGSSRVMPLAVP